MDCIATRLPYRQTNSFSRITLDYIDQAPSLSPFFEHSPSLQGIRKAISNRKAYEKQNKEYRDTLVRTLKEQYAGRNTGEKVTQNIEALLSPDTFTITTAHQNNIFTGPLYFIYKIIHAIRVADHLNEMIPASKFVPVFYMGSEDADLDELNHVHLGGKKLVWETRQTGAVGRMAIDKALIKLVDEIEGQLSVLPHGSGYTAMLRKHYVEGSTIQLATFGFVDELFSKYGLVVLLPDNRELKKQFSKVMQTDLLDHSSFPIVKKATDELEAAGYKGQAFAREINLFYLAEGVRGRIDKVEGTYSVQMPETVKGPAINFTKEAITLELEEFPDRFSPNVILRGIYQETILPDVAFIGGGGELAYWLQLRSLFDNYAVPFPVLVLRNSFMILEKKWAEKIQRLGFRKEDMFTGEEELVAMLVRRESNAETKLNGSMPELEKLYDNVKKQATGIDSTLERHVEALKVRTLQKLEELEKKMWRAEKRKFSDQQRQITALRNHLFPGNGLQERHDHLGQYYALWGPAFIDTLYDHSPALEQEFVILEVR